MLWIKALHLIAVTAWLAGLFYLPRIFVHYAEGLAAGEDVRRLVIMARRLFGFMTASNTIGTTISSGASLSRRSCSGLGKDAPRVTRPSSSRQRP